MKTSTVLKKLSTATTLAVISVSTVVISRVEAQIIQVPYNNTLPGSVNFSDVTVPPPPTTSIAINNNILSSGGVNFAERFNGQTLTYNGNFDVLSGNGTNPLTLQVGINNQNLAVERITGFTTYNVLSGVGPNGYPNASALGEGAFAALFQRDQSQVGFRLGGGNGGTATVQFFDRSGLGIGSFTLNVPNNVSNPFGFKTNDGSYQIAGFSIFNNDTNGIYLAQVVYDAVGAPPVQNVPEPHSLLGLVAIGALGVGLKLKRKLTGKNSANKENELSNKL